jgi:hypothetical protein
MSYTSDQLRRRAGDFPADLRILAWKAADELDAASFDLACLWECLHGITGQLTSEAQIKYAMQGRFEKEFELHDPRRYSLWRACHLTLKRLEEAAREVQAEERKRGGKGRQLKGEWVADVLRAGVDALWEERRAE